MAIQINNSPNARTGYRVSVRKLDFGTTTFYEVWGVDTKTRAWLALARANKVSYERACYDVSFTAISKQPEIEANQSPSATIDPHTPPITNMSNLIAQLKSIQAQLSQAIESESPQDGYNSSFEFWSELQQAQDHLSAAIDAETSNSDDSEDDFELKKFETIIPVSIPVLSEAQGNAINYVLERAIRNAVNKNWLSTVVYLSGNQDDVEDENSYQFMYEGNWEIQLKEKALGHPHPDNIHLVSITREQAQAWLERSAEEYERYLNDA